MKEFFLAAWVTCLVVACGGSGGQPANGGSHESDNLVPASKHYSNTEMQDLTLCAGFGDVVFHVVQRKAEGSTLEAELERLRSGPGHEGENGDFLEALVQDLYQQPNQPALAVLDSFYQFCAAEFAAIPPDRAALAGRCLRVQHVALEAYYLRGKGESREAVAEHFKAFDFSAAVVDRAFAFSDPSGDYLKRAELTNGEFKRCFAEAE